MLSTGGKALSLLAMGNFKDLSLISSPNVKAKQECAYKIPMLSRQRQADPLDLLASQPSTISERGSGRFSPQGKSDHGLHLNIQLFSREAAGRGAFTTVAEKNRETVRLGLVLLKLWLASDQNSGLHDGSIFPHSHLHGCPLPEQQFLFTGLDFPQ